MTWEGSERTSSLIGAAQPELSPIFVSTVSALPPPSGRHSD